MTTKTLASLLAALLPCAASADEIFLKSGGRLSGRIVSRNETTIEVDVGAGRVGVPAASVLRIEEGVSALQEYEARAGRIAPGDAEGWIALGDWARDQGLGSQAREAYNRALAARPDDPRANEALGNVRTDGRWMSEDESYRSRGYVEFEGDWITPAEHDAILRERAAESARERERQEADSRVREAEARAEEAEARARQAESDASQTSVDGVPLWYAWGAGPAVWPTRPVVTPRPVARPVARPR
jgi:hypothetical protein